MNKNQSLLSSPALLSSRLRLSFCPRLACPSPPQASDLVIERNAACKPKPDPSTLVFGKQFSDHMLTINWSAKAGWEAPRIKPFQNLSLHPATSALHYSIEVSASVIRSEFIH